MMMNKKIKRMDDIYSLLNPFFAKCLKINFWCINFRDFSTFRFCLMKNEKLGCSYNKKY